MPSEIVQPRVYLRTFCALILLLALTIGASFLKLGPLSIAAAMLISVAKAALIILFFMEVRYSQRMVWLFATAGFLWLGLMIFILLGDYATRQWVGPDWRAGVNGSNHVEFVHPR